MCQVSCDGGDQKEALLEEYLCLLGEGVEAGDVFR